jgi:hypothetical protein
VLCSTVSLSRAVDKVYIDNFCDGDPDLTEWSAGSVEITEVGLFEVMGGERYSRVEILGLTQSSASLRIEPTGGQVLLSSDAGVQAVFSLVYGKNHDLDEDFFEGQGDDTVFVEWAGWTDADAEVTVILLNDHGGVDEQQAQVTKTTLGGPACQIMEFSFAQFKLDNPLMSFDDIDMVTFYVEGRPGWDGQMAFMVPLALTPYLPEPASMTLLGVAGIALIRRRRRR